LYETEELEDSVMLAFYENNTDASFARSVQYEKTFKEFADTTLQATQLHFYAILNDANALNNLVINTAGDPPPHLANYKAMNQFI